MSFAPWFRSPFTDLTGAIISHQWYGPCNDLELKLLDCLEAYGIDRGIVKCDVIVKDFQECAGRQKQRNRAYAMRLERHRQYLTGERSKENYYATPPKVDSY